MSRTLYVLIIAGTFTVIQMSMCSPRVVTHTCRLRQEACYWVKVSLGHRVRLNSKTKYEQRPVLCSSLGGELPSPHRALVLVPSTAGAMSGGDTGLRFQQKGGRSRIINSRPSSASEFWTRLGYRRICLKKQDVGKIEVRVFNEASLVSLVKERIEWPH